MDYRDSMLILGLMVSAILWTFTLFLSDSEDEPKGYKGGHTPDRYKMDEFNNITASPSRARRRARRFRP